MIVAYYNYINSGDLEKFFKYLNENYVNIYHFVIKNINKDINIRSVNDTCKEILERRVIKLNLEEINKVKINLENQKVLTDIEKVKEQIKISELIESTDEFKTCLSNINDKIIIELITLRMCGFLPKLSSFQIDKALDYLLCNPSKELVWKFSFNFGSKIINQYKIEDYFIKEADPWYITEYLHLVIDNVNEEKMLKYLIDNKNYDEVKEVYEFCFSISQEFKKTIENILQKNTNYES